jgi:CRP-like cAMP-binding protein
MGKSHFNTREGVSSESTSLPLLTGMTSASNWPLNRLLLALPPDNLKRLLRELEQVRCQRGDVLIDADSSLDYVFFPDSGVISVVAVYANGDIIEMATIGREGCSGLQAIFGARSSSVRFLVQIPGNATRLSHAAFTRAMDSMPAFRRLMFAYVQAFLEQVLVSGACNGAHSLKERLARWLLMMRDRTDGDTLLITQDLLAEMLGAHRPSITHAARELELAGLIERGRRQVTILDREGLKRASCECYQLVRDRIAFHLPKTYT